MKDMKTPLMGDCLQDILNKKEKVAVNIIQFNKNKESDEGFINKSHKV